MEEIQVMVMPFPAFPEGNILAILNALGRPIIISVAKHLPEERRAMLVEDLKLCWQALVGSKENEIMQIIVRDVRAKPNLEPKEDGSATCASG